MKTALLKRTLQKGFTLVELIVVIAILGVLAVVLITTIDPGDKIKAGNDAKVYNDIREIYGANQRYVALNNANGTSATLVSSGELKLFPAAPGGYSAYVMVNSSAAGVTDVVTCGNILAKSSLAKSTAANTIGGTACTSTSTTCHVVMTQNKSCYKPTACVAGDVCP